MKRTTLILLTILIISLYNCDDADFSKINNHFDWQLNDEFSKREKKLFDSLDFDKTAVYESEETGFIGDIPRIGFSPNPFTDVADLEYNTAPIINIVIVNRKYEKVIEGKFENSYRISFNFSDEPAGIYRLYYVIQDAEYNIVQLGHGNIKKK